MTDKLLLLSCCAPCSCAVIEKLANEKQDFLVVFYNPNIQPENEYHKRCDENKRLCEKFGVEFVELEYDNQRWCDLISGFEKEPERGRRCSICFEMRLRRVMDYAWAKGCTKVASVLGVSRYKDLAQVNEAGARVGKECGVEYVPIEGRKAGMQERRVKLATELELYAQDYCGCIYSQRKI